MKNFNTMGTEKLLLMKKGSYLVKKDSGEISAFELQRTNENIVITMKNEKNETLGFVLLPIEKSIDFVDKIITVTDFSETKDNAIDKIKRIIGEWGSVSCAELELKNYPRVNSLSDGNVTEIIESFRADGVETKIYHDDIEIDSNYYYYEELPYELVFEILDILNDYEAEMLKTEKRCQS